MEELETEYTKEEKFIDLRQANRIGCLIMLPILLLYGALYALVWHSSLSLRFFKGMFTGDSTLFWYGVVPFLVVMVGIVVHELIHGLFFAFFAKQGFKSIKFGIIKEHLTPYCHCKEPLKLSHYIIGALMPLIILGIIPAVISIVIGSIPLLLFAFIFTVSAIGDVLVVRLLWGEDKNVYVQDHPTEAGCYLYRAK